MRSHEEDDVLAQELARAVAQVEARRTVPSLVIMGLLVGALSLFGGATAAYALTMAIVTWSLSATVLLVWVKAWPAWRSRRRH